MNTNYQVLKVIARAGEYLLADIAVRLAARDINLFLEIAAEAGCDVPATTYIVNGDERVVYPDVMATIKTAYMRSYDSGGFGPGGYNKVSAIKEARNLMNLGLKEAKDLVEHMMEKGALPTLPKAPEPQRPAASLGDLLRDHVDHDPNGRRYY